MVVLLVIAAVIAWCVVLAWALLVFHGITVADGWVTLPP